MADSTLDGSFITLIDNWPGVAKPLNIPNFKLGVSNWTFQNVPVTTPRIPKPGDKFIIYNDAAHGYGVAGFATLIYLTLGTQNPDAAIAAKVFCVPEGASTPYVVSNDPNTVGNATGASHVAVALGAMTDTYGGYFWCGGVCPSDVIYSGATYVLDGNYATVNDVEIGPMAISPLAGEAIGLTILVATSSCIGWTGSADV